MYELRGTLIALALISPSYLARCDSGSTLSPELPPIVVFQKILEREVPEVEGSSNFPSGIAVTPDGRWIISLGFSNGTVSLYDAETLDLVAGPFHYLHSSDSDSIQIVQPHAVVVSPDGAFAVLTNRTGVIGFSLPSFDILFHTLIPGLVSPRHIVRDRAGENYYVSSEGTGIGRLTSSGEAQDFFEDAVITTAMALTRNEGDVLVVTDNGRRVVVLATPDLNLRRTIELPAEFEGQVIVPLKAEDRAIIVGGSPSAGETSVGAPLKVLPVNLATGALGQIQPLTNPDLGRFLLGDGNEWTDTGDATAIVPTGIGTVTIDTNRGAATFHTAADLQRESPPCCDISSYPTPDRVVFSSLDVGADPGGSLIIYAAEEQVISTQN